MIERSLKSRILSPLKFIAIFVTSIWIVYFLSILLPLREFGLIPRTLQGLPGIVTSPFLHGSFFHLLGNTISFISFAFFLALLEGEKMFSKLFFIVLIGGVLTWLFGRSANHIGASGLIFGMWGYMLLSGWFSRKIQYIFVSFILIGLYSGMVFGLFPLRSGVSFESHIFGFIAGVFVAWDYHKKSSPKDGQNVSSYSNTL